MRFTAIGQVCGVLVWTLSAAMPAHGQLMITEVVDGDLPGGLPKFVELKNVSASTLNLADYSLGNFNNGQTTLGGDAATVLSGSLGPGGVYVVSYENGDAPGTGLFYDTYGFDPDNFTLGSFTNGDDVIALYSGAATGDGSNASLVDIYGVIGVDGTGEFWEYTDGYSYRQLAVTAPNSSFTPSEWFFGGVDSLDGGDAAGDTQRLLDLTTPGSHGSDLGTVLWDFNDSGPALPPGWTNEDFNWEVAEGQLVPCPCVEGESVADSPIFRSVPSTNGAPGGASGGSGSTVTVSIPYDPNQLEGGGQIADGFSAELLIVGTQTAISLIDLSFGFLGDWTSNDSADGVQDNVINLEQEIEPNTDYRLRFRAYDFDSIYGTLVGLGIDHISVTDGVIVGLGPALPGDYNGNGIVDAADYTKWRDNLGKPAGTLINDADGGPIGIDQYNTWVDNFGHIGSGSAASSAAAVPEPASWLLLIGGSLLLATRRRR